MSVNPGDLNARDIAAIKAFAESVWISQEPGQSYEINCNWCSGNTGQWGTVDLEDVVDQALEHLRYFHPEKMRPFVPVTDDEIRQVFGLPADHPVGSGHPSGSNIQRP